MAALLSALNFQTVLVREGCAVIPLPGWDVHNRDAGHTPLTPNGVMIHHTGSDTSDPAGYARNILWPGYAGLPGPLCHTGGAPDGRLYLVGHGRANHAGGGDPAVLAAVIADAVPTDSELHPHFGNLKGVDGNPHFYGLEIMYSGGHPMTAAQRIAAVKWSTAICRAHGWTAGSVIGHREWSSDKVDPGQCPMDAFRRDVATALSLPAGQWSPAQGGPTPAPPRPTGFLMALTDAEQGELLAHVRELVNIARTGRRDGDVKVWPFPFTPADATLGQAQRNDQHAQVRADALTATMAKLAGSKDLTLEQVKAALAEVVAESVTVTGSLDIGPAASTP